MRFLSRALGYLSPVLGLVGRNADNRTYFELSHALQLKDLLKDAPRCHQTSSRWAELSRASRIKHGPCASDRTGRSANESRWVCRQFGSKLMGRLCCLSLTRWRRLRCRRWQKASRTRQAVGIAGREVQGTHASRRGVPISYYGAPGACEHRAVGVAGREMQGSGSRGTNAARRGAPIRCTAPGACEHRAVGLAGRGVQGSGTDAGRRGAPICCGAPGACEHRPPCRQLQRPKWRHKCRECHHLTSDAQVEVQRAALYRR